MGDVLSIYIPTDKGVITPEELAEAAKEALQTKLESPDTEPAPEPERDDSKLKPAYKLIHTVAAGDTLTNISKRYKVSIADIKFWNGLESDNVRLDSQLTILLGRGTPEDEEETTPEDEALSGELPGPDTSVPQSEVPDDSVAEPAPEPVRDAAPHRGNRTGTGN